MDKSVPKHRKKLNASQLEVLYLLYKFRFGSNDLFAQYFGKKDRSFVHKRLTILLDQRLIGKRFDSSYRIQGKTAAYYLLPEGARRLQEARGIEVSIKSIYKDRIVSEQFVRYRMELFAIYNQLRTQYGDTLKLFTAPELNKDGYGYFPHPLPDAYIRLKASRKNKQFFLDVFHDDQPYFVAVRKILQYVKYDEDAEWGVTDTDLPIVLAICESPSLAKHVQKRIAKALNDVCSDSLTFAVTTKAALLNGQPTIWQKVDGPSKKLSLGNIS